MTGADGFAGSHLCEALVNRGARVRAMVRPGDLKNLSCKKGIEIVTGDVLDFQSLLNATRRVDTLFHAAAITLIPETRSVISNTFATNSLGTLNVLLAAKENEVRKIVYISTCHVYGKQDRLPITEESTPKPIDIYSASKLTGEHICTSFLNMFKMDVSISRAFNHFGPRQRSEFLIPTIVAKLLEGETVIKLGDPNPTRDYSYVTDIVEGYILIAEGGRPGEIYHLCSGVERTVRELANRILEVAGSDAKIEWNPGSRTVDLPRSFGSYDKTKRELGWTPKTTFEDGIKKTIEWYSYILDQRQ